MADERHFMNPVYGRHVGGTDEDLSDREPTQTSEGEKPHIFIHSHSNGHTVHIHHKDGRHEKHEHEPGDAEGIASHIHQAFGGTESPAEERAEERVENEHGEE